MTHQENDSAISVNLEDDNASKYEATETLDHLDQPSATPPADNEQTSSTTPRSKSPKSLKERPTEDKDAQARESVAAFQQAQQDIDVDSLGDGENDAGYETASLSSASTSISSSVLNYRFENGRRYHAFRDGAYHFPNDEREQDREDMKHAMTMTLCQQLHFAPIGPNPQNILDLGTGTGIWAIEMGDQYPGSHILGVDLSPIQPEWVPANVKFEVDDIESPWLRPENYFQYIHARHTVMAIKNWPRLMQQVLRHLKPGGWFELQEVHHVPVSHDDSIPENWPVLNFWKEVQKGLIVLGADPHAVLNLEEMMRDAGFTNVSTRVFYIPIGQWPRNGVLKLVGEYWRMILLEGAEPIALGPLTRGLGWSKEKIDVWLVDVRKAYWDWYVHAYMPFYIICGQKPDEEQSG
ncbi:hypothetical protein B7463_g6742, partial [Scytalidium lignicola]